MPFQFFKKKIEIEDTCLGLSNCVADERLKDIGVKPSKIYQLEQKIKAIEKQVKELQAKKAGELEMVFKPVAHRIAYHLSVLTNTQARFVFNPIGGASYALDADGVPKYRVYLSCCCGVALHTWRYNKRDDGYTPEYNRIEAVHIYLNGTPIHNFTKYSTDEQIFAHLEAYCKAGSKKEPTPGVL